MAKLRFKNNRCEEHLAVETFDDWCPVCLGNERDMLKKQVTELNEALRIRLVSNGGLPQAKESVLALVKSKWGDELYIERACYIPPKSIRADDFFLDDLEDESVEEYDEELDLYWVAEGWWEDSHEANVNWKITGEVIGWWELPKIEVEA